MPRTKQIESRTFDLPLPLSPVMALNWESKPEMTVRVAYDLKPSSTISMMCIPAAAGRAPGPLPPRWIERTWRWPV